MCNIEYTDNIYTHTHTYVYGCAHALEYACLLVPEQMQTYIREYANLHSPTHTYKHLFSHICIYLNTHIFAHIGTSKHTYSSAYAHIHVCRCDLYTSIHTQRHTHAHIYMERMFVCIKREMKDKQATLGNSLLSHVDTSQKSECWRQSQSQILGIGKKQQTFNGGGPKSTASIQCPPFTVLVISGRNMSGIRAFCLLPTPAYRAVQRNRAGIFWTDESSLKYR